MNIQTLNPKSEEFFKLFKHAVKNSFDTKGNLIEEWADTSDSLMNDAKKSGLNDDTSFMDVEEISFSTYLEFFD